MTSKILTTFENNFSSSLTILTRSSESHVTATRNENYHRHLTAKTKTHTVRQKYTSSSNLAVSFVHVQNPDVSSGGVYGNVCCGMCGTRRRDGYGAPVSELSVTEHTAPLPQSS